MSAEVPMLQATDPTADLVRVSLDIAQLRAQVASANIANAHTPGFRPQRVAFGDALAALGRAVDDPASMPATLDALRAAPLRIDAQTVVSVLDAQVNLDQEVAELTVAGTHYQALVDSLNRHFGLMQLAIKQRS